MSHHKITQICHPGPLGLTLRLSAGFATRSRIHHNHNYTLSIFPVIRHVQSPKTEPECYRVLIDKSDFFFQNIDIDYRMFLPDQEWNCRLNHRPAKHCQQPRSNGEKGELLSIFFFRPSTTYLHSRIVSNEMPSFGFRLRRSPIRPNAKIISTSQHYVINIAKGISNYIKCLQGSISRNCPTFYIKITCGLSLFMDIRRLIKH